MDRKAGGGGFLQELDGEIIRQIYIIPDKHPIPCLHAYVNADMYV